MFKNIMLGISGAFIGIGAVLGFASLVLGFQIGFAWLFAHPVLWLVTKGFPEATFNQVWIGLFAAFFLGNLFRATVTNNNK